MKYTKSLILLLAFTLMASVGQAQVSDSDTQTVNLDIDEIAEIASVGGPITMTIVAPTTPGAPPADPTDSSTDLQYTSVVTDPATRAITAQIDVNPPAGTSLLLTASDVDAAEGSAAGQITLSTASAQNLITGIGSVNTGTGAGDGPTMDYVWQIDDVTQLDHADDNVVTVTFTLTAAT